MSSVQAPPADVVGIRARRAERFAAQRILWAESRLERVQRCGKTSIMSGGDTVLKVTTAPDGGTTAGFGGLHTCGSTWACPVCSAKIAAVRAGDLQGAVDEWKRQGGQLAMLTLTMRHRKGQALNDLWDALSKSWAKVTSGRSWKAEQVQYGTVMPRLIKSGERKGQVERSSRIGFSRVVEVTHGGNGWHVHIHALLFLGAGVDADDVQLLAESMFGRWVNTLTAQGFAAPSQKHGVDVRMVADASGLADYFTKNTYVARQEPSRAGWELAGGQGKTARSGNRTPFQILADIAAGGDAVDLDLWHEWERVSRGRRQLTWSAGLRAFLALGAEATDEEIAEQEIDGVVTHRFPAHVWRVIRHDKGGILDAVEAGIPFRGFDLDPYRV